MQGPLIYKHVKPLASNQGISYTVCNAGQSVMKLATITQASISHIENCLHNVIFITVRLFFTKNTFSTSISWTMGQTISLGCCGRRCLDCNSLFMQKQLQTIPGVARQPNQLSSIHKFSFQKVGKLVLRTNGEPLKIKY